MTLNSIKTLFLDNQNLRQTVFKNTFWLTVGTGLSRLMGFVLMVYVARLLGATEYGKFAFALAFVSLFTVIADFGISTILVREFSKEKGRESEFNALFSLKIVLGMIMIAMILIGSLFITKDPGIQKIVIILAIYTLLNSFIDTIYAFFQSRQKMELQAGAAIFGGLFLTAIGFLAILSFPSAMNLSLAFLVSTLITLASVLIFFHFKVFSLKLSFESGVWRKFMMMSWPLAFTSLFGLLYTYIDSVMLGYFNQVTENGYYNAAYRIAWMAYIFAGLAVTSFYPILSQAFGESKEKFQQIWNFQMELMIGLAAPLMIGGVVLAPRIVDMLYGPEFAPSILAFQILIVMAGVLLVYAAFYQILIVANHQKKIFMATLLGALINIALNLILIPKYSLYGAAFASLVTQVLLLIMLVGFTIKNISVRFLNLRMIGVLLTIFLAGAVMYFSLRLPEIYYLNVFLSIVIGAAAYGAILFGSKYLLSRIAFIYGKV